MAWENNIRKRKYSSIRRSSEMKTASVMKERRKPGYESWQSENEKPAKAKPMTISILWRRKPKWRRNSENEENIISVKIEKWKSERSNRNNEKHEMKKQA